MLGFDVRRAARVVLPLYLGGIYATLSVARTITETLRTAGYLRAAVLLAFTLATLAVLALALSQRAALTWRVAAALGASAAVYVLLIYPMQSPEEKLHFIEYGVVALLADAAAPAAWSARRRFFSAAVFVAAAGWIDEGIQAILPNRFYDLRDVQFNAAAGAVALGSLALLRWAREDGRGCGQRPPD